MLMLNTISNNTQWYANETNIRQISNTPTPQSQWTRFKMLDEDMNNNWHLFSGHLR